ncbi:MAG: hypothetical protein K6B74_10835 [Ruminococcus sp.]|nr:hypothetical protein [Ruminococcus sp.]
MCLVKKPIKSFLLAGIYLAAWLVIAVGFRLLADEVLDSTIMHIAFTMIIMPAAAFVIPFIFARRGGQRLWLAGYMLAAALVLYVAFGYNELQPDFMATNIICGFFGFGTGGIIRKEPIASAQIACDNAKKIAEEQAEKNYQPITATKKKK